MWVSQPVVVTGASGRVGRLLRHGWGSGQATDFATLWLARKAVLPDVAAWDIGAEPAPDLPRNSVILHLAGTTRADDAALDRTESLTAEVCAAAIRSDARHVFIASSVAVYAPGPVDIAETATPGPLNAYGAAKLAAERRAMDFLSAPGAPRLTILRIGNIAGADALLGNRKADVQTVLDPVPGQDRGPLRSYIGPQVLADVLAGLITLAGRGAALPQFLNIAQPPVLAMADLLDAAAQPWRFGPPRHGVVARVGVAVDRLAALVPLPAASARSIMDDLQSCEGRWP